MFCNLVVVQAPHDAAQEHELGDRKNLRDCRVEDSTILRRRMRHFARNAMNALLEF